MGVLTSILRPARTLVILSTLAGVVSGVSGVALIALVQEATGGGQPANPARLAAMFAGLCLLAASTRLLAQSATIRLAHGASSALAIRVCRGVLQLPLERFEAIDHAKLLAVLTEDIGVVANTLAGFPLATLNMAIVVVCLGYIGWMAPAVLFSGALFAVVAGATHRLTSSHAVDQLRAARTRQDSLVGHYRTLIGGFRELKQHGPRRDAFLADALIAESLAVRDRMVGGLTSFALAATWGQLAYFGFIGFVVFGLPRFVAIDGSSLSGLVLALLYLFVPLDVLVNWGSNIARARASLGRIDALMPTLDAGREDLAGPKAEPLAFAASLRLDGVGYAYRAGAGHEGFALGPVDLMIGKGEVVFIAGGNGSGKTTLMKLIAGLYKPDSGQITLDGRAIGADDLEAYRQLFSVIFADGHLFREVRGVASDDLLERSGELLARLGLEGVVRFDGSAFSTVDLSQGQKRRLALLTACLEARPICLFDEWAANQDPSFKRIFYREVLPELRAAGKTLVVISHDDEYLGVADRVVRLRDGRIVEDSLAARDSFDLALETSQSL